MYKRNHIAITQQTTIIMSKFPNTCSYRAGLEWMHISTILCNRIPTVDETVIENLLMYTDVSDEEIFQWFITDATKDTIEFMQEHFDGYLFSYSDLLDCYILCVDHYGTSWDLVTVDTDLDIK